MHARPTYCYANKARDGLVLALSIIEFLVVETHVVLKEDEAACRRFEHRISLLREADRSVIHSPTRTIPTRTKYHLAGSTRFQSPGICCHKLLTASLLARTS